MLSKIVRETKGITYKVSLANNEGSNIYLKDDKVDDFIDQDILDKKIINHLIEITKCSIKDILSITQNGLEKVFN